MRSNAVLLIFAVIIFLSFGCDKKPVTCTACNGTGKIIQSFEAPLPFDIVECKFTDAGLFNPDYYADITITNKGDKDGMFTAIADFIYAGIGEHSEQAEIFIRAHSTATKKIRYDADKRADKFGCKVNPPRVVQTKEEICPVCGGKGIRQ